MKIIIFWGVKQRSLVEATEVLERSSYIKKGCFEKSQKYCSTGDRPAELNIHLEDPVSTKTVRRELHKLNIDGKAAVAKRLITESNAQLRKGWCHDHKTWTSDNCKLPRVIWSNESSFTLFPTSGRVYVWRTLKEACNSEILVPTVKHGGGSVIVWAAGSWYRILLVPLLPSMAELLQGSTWTG
jgi:hypothetical protein